MAKTKTETSKDPPSTQTIGVSTALVLHLLFASAIAASHWIARNIYSVHLISHPDQTLRLFCMVETPVVILLYCHFRQDPDECSYLKAVARGVIGLPIGALLMAFGAIMLGAPIGIQYFTKTIYWSLLMSVFSFVPAACVFGSSWKDWQRLFAHTKPSGALEYMMCVPAHAAIVGAWIGAWPMPLDWERPWQEWPICVSYGTVGGYVAGLLVSVVFIFVFRGSEQHVKGD